MEIIEIENLNEARKKTEKISSEGKIVAVKGRNIEFNRKILEMKNVNMLILYHKEKSDKLKQRDSGLNHILCKIAKEKNITIAIDFSEILGTQGRERAEVLARLIQNLKLIKKYKNSFKIINKSGRDNYDLRAFLHSLGIPTNMAKMAVE